LLQVFGLTNQDLRTRITKYVVNETRVIQEKFEDLFRLTTGKWSNVLQYQTNVILLTLETLGMFSIFWYFIITQKKFN